MPITSDQIKLFQSEVMTDDPDGGGGMSAVEVIDGDLNNLFDDTSELDRIRGRCSIRFMYGGVLTDDRAALLGTHVYLTDPPDDSKVVNTVLALRGWGMRREAARQYIEQYLSAGSPTVMTLFEMHPAGSRALVVYQPKESALPEVSDVLVLSIEKAGHINYGFQQFVRITAVSEEPYMVDPGSNTQVEKRLVTLTISEPLEVDFPGGNIVKEPKEVDRPTRIRATNQNAGVRYYGVVPVTEAIDAGDSALKVSSILASVVPASYSETPLLDLQLGPEAQALVPAGPAYTETITTVSDAGGNLAVVVPRAMQPGSVSVFANASTDANDASLVDAGAGVLERSSGGVNVPNAAGTANYLSREVALSGLAPNVSYSVAVTYVPAATISGVQHTKGTPITLVNRGFNYPTTLIPAPLPGSVVFEYMAYGRWYTLRDNGAGQLIGANGIGAGTVNYVTGGINPTCGTQPDVGSHVLYAHSSKAHYRDQSAESAVQVGAIRLTLEEPVVPGGLGLSWTNGVTTYTVSDDGAGILTGDCLSGTVDYSGRVVQFVPTVYPPKGSEIEATYNKTTAATHVPDPQPLPGGGSVSMTLPGAPLEPGALTLRVRRQSAITNEIRVFTLRDDGSTLLLREDGSTGGGVDHSLGTLYFNQVELHPYYVYNAVAGTWGTDSQEWVYLSVVDARYSPAGAGSAHSEEIDLQQLVADFRGVLLSGLAASSILFDLNGVRYRDVAGTLVSGPESAPVDSGTMDVQSGEGVITSWAAGPRVAATRAVLAAYGRRRLDRVVWRTLGRPLRSESFQVTNGTVIAVANPAGTLVGAGGSISGSVNADTGVYDVGFGGTQPFAEQARYSAAVQTYVPQNPAILGLNPVRLPLDGRVPVIQPGDTLVLHNTMTETLPNPVVAGTTYGLARDRLAYAVLYDQEGTKIPSDRYTAHLGVDAATTMANPLNLDGYVQPLIVEHRIQDKFMCNDAQLSGDVTIFGSITHDYPVEGTYLSSAFDIGDLRSRATTPFDQQAWMGEWSDEVQGGEAVATYNSGAYPIEVTNAGAVEERWRIEFTNSANFRLIGEKAGVVATGNKDLDFSPINPSTGEPYFTVRAEGWGEGWAGGNQLRFNTIAAFAQLTLVRCTLQGPAEAPLDSARISFVGGN